MQYLQRARALLFRMFKDSKFTSYTKEGFLSEVCGILSVTNANFTSQEFYRVHISEINNDFDESDGWMYKVINDALSIINDNSTSTNEVWQMLINPPLIAGPWIPHNGKCYRYNMARQPIAIADSHIDVACENRRLQKLGYLLTDVDRNLPEHFFYTVSEKCSEVQED